MARSAENGHRETVNRRGAITNRLCVIGRIADAMRHEGLGIVRNKPHSRMPLSIPTLMRGEFRGIPLKRKHVVCSQMLIYAISVAGMHSVP